MNNTKQTVKWLQQAGFTTYNETPKSSKGQRPYVCFTHYGTNSFSDLIYTDQPEGLILEIIFGKCKQVGRIQIRQQLHELTSNMNYE
jgi:hypothetical protein